MNNFKGYLIVREILKKQDLFLYKYTIQDLVQNSVQLIMITVQKQSVFKYCKLKAEKEIKSKCF